MIKFYQTLLIAEIVHSGPVITFLRYDEEHHRIAILQIPDILPKPKDSVHAGIDHIAFTFPTLTALDQRYVYLKSLDKLLPPLWTVNHGPTTSMYYRDPDRNRIELQVENFDDNPIGTDYDADEWAKEILGKALPTGEEGLTSDEIKEKKMKEIGERVVPPKNFLV